MVEVVEVSLGGVGLFRGCGRDAWDSGVQPQPQHFMRLFILQFAFRMNTFLKTHKGTLFC